MDGYKFLKPNGKLIIRDPKSKIPLSPKGEYKPFVGSEGTYWRRRVNDGSCIIVDKAAKKKEEKRKKEVSYGY